MKKIIMIIICLSFLFPGKFKYMSKKEKTKFIAKNFFLGVAATCLWSSVGWTVKNVVEFQREERSK